MNVPRWAALPTAAAVAVLAMIAVQLQQGGGRYEPLTPPDPCSERPATGQVDDIEGLTERLVLTGLAAAACSLGVSREELTLRIVAQADAVGESEVSALRDGLSEGVKRMAADGTLPPASTLAGEAIAHANLSPLVEKAALAVPDRAIDAAVDLEDVLRRAIADLDLAALLADLTDQAAVNGQVQAAITQAAKDSLIARIKALVPDLPKGPRLPNLPPLPDAPKLPDLSDLPRLPDPSGS